MLMNATANLSNLTSVCKSSSLKQSVFARSFNHHTLNSSDLVCACDGTDLLSIIDQSCAFFVPASSPPQPTKNSKMDQYIKKGLANAQEVKNVRHDARNKLSVQHTSKNGKSRSGRIQTSTDRVSKRRSKKSKHFDD